MISPTNLMKRLGVGGRLVAFFKAVCVYFVVAGGEAGEAPSVAGVAAKCAPVLCLMVLVALHALDAPAHCSDRRAYGARVAAGLALSALGDALLVWPQHFVAGMGAFAGAHVAYLSAFGWQGSAPRAAAACYGGCGAYLCVVAPGGLLARLVPGYALLLATLCWRGAARGGPAAAGAALFLVSDAALGYSLWAGPLPHRRLVVMSTYYLGQLGIALSALQPHPPAPPRAHAQ
ncbi:lysoplasmalogenase [Pectinophora gossypiella]|uniref:lysoplasmalogenase n=1 Tax=Pectinophora gossypiella TaxID=13191 RepID=UPI00214F196C|nr:lysoplasmalogenase [Pectinophora gossypiella]